MTEEKKSMVPKLRFPEFTETWEQRELSSLSELITKGTSPLSKRNDGDINFIKVENLDSFSGKILSCSKVSKEEHLTYLRRSILFKGDILFSIAGTLGRTAIVPEDILPANTNQALAIIRTKNQDLRFLLAALKSRTVTDFIKKNPTVGAQPNLSLAQVGSLKIPYPARAEQEKIGEFFSQLDTTITLHQRKLEGLSKLKKSLLQKMFPKNGSLEPELRFPGFIGDWEQRNLFDSIQKITDFRGRTPKKLGMEWSEKGIPALSALNVKDGYIDLSQDIHFGNQKLYEKWMAGNELHKGQVLFTTEAPMGNVAQLPDNNKYILSQRTIAFNVKKDILSEDFLAILLRSPSVFRELTALSTGGTAKGVSQKTLAGVKVRVPKLLEEQKEIAELFSRMNGCITLHQRKLESLKKLKTSLLQQMFV